MQSASHMARFGARLVTNGYAILPIGPGTKKPGRFQRGGWTDYPEWNRHAERPTTEVEVATWAAWPDCGIGIVGGAVAAVDIDIATDAELALQIEALARARLGDTPSLRIGRRRCRSCGHAGTHVWMAIATTGQSLLKVANRVALGARPRRIA